MICLAFSFSKKQKVLETEPEVEELDRGIFSINVKSATATPKAKSFEFGFESVQITTYSNNTKSYYVAVDDELFSGDVKDYEAQSSLNEAPSFAAYIYHIEKDINGSTDVYVPSVFTYGKRFSLNVNRIASECAVCEADDGDETTVERNDFKGISNIYIPSEITAIEKEAFLNVPSEVTINCEASSKPEGWDANWTDAANIVWGAKIDAKNKKGAFGAGGETKFGDAVNIVCGTASKPLIVTYDVKKTSGEVETKSMELDVIDSLNPYDGVGSKLGKNQFSRTIDFEVDVDSDIDPDSFVFSNIYRAKLNESGKIAFDSKNLPESDGECKAAAVKRFSKVINLSDIITFKFKKISTFSGYTTISMDVDLVTPSAYPVLMPSVYNNYLPEINEGKYRIRYAFYNVNSASYNIGYKVNGEVVYKQVKVKSPIATFELKHEEANHVSFLIKNSDVGDDFNPNNLVEFDLIGAYVNVHLWNVKNNSKLGRSEYCKRFGHISVMSANDEMKQFNVDVFLSLFFVAYIAIYVAAATGLYFYLKNKYKNDEFRRMKTKPYLKKAGLGLGGSGVILLATLFIILRTTALKDSIVVFNPADIFIVIAGLASIIILGYFIKFLVQTTKANKQRKTAIKLKLNDDVADDGTK